MFVRWKKRGRKGRWWDQGETYSLYAYLVESYRDDSGKPKQRHLAYLGRIRNDQKLTYWIVEEFWKSADSRLDEVGLSGDQRELIEKKLEEAVPRPSEELMNHSAALLKEALSKIANGM